MNWPCRTARVKSGKRSEGTESPAPPPRAAPTPRPPPRPWVIVLGEAVVAEHDPLDARLRDELDRVRRQRERGEGDVGGMEVAGPQHRAGGGLAQSLRRGLALQSQ